MDFAKSLLAPRVVSASFEIRRPCGSLGGGEHGTAGCELLEEIGRRVTGHRIRARFTHRD